ncbi:phytanoyl-CoA dioxygenase family protein [Chloroflexi bacterium TSY]|nr:phytanoyl-CoA dioxygenase family protein [Chloroflexi bacterium TSY]
MQTHMAAKSSYLRDGFYVHPSAVIGVDVVQAAVHGMDEVRAGRYDTGTPPQPSRWNPGDDPNTKLGKIEMPQIANHAIMELMQVPALGELAAEVTGAEAVQIWWVQLLYKPSALPNVATAPGIGWHQDRHYWQSWEGGSELFTAWVALSDVTADAGPMTFVRGSHRWGYVEGQSDFQQEADQVALRNRIEGATGERWEEVAAILPLGGVSFHHNLTYHGSEANLSGAPRRSFAIHMRTEKSRPIDGRRAGLTRFIDDLDYCPMIFGEREWMDG